MLTGIERLLNNGLSIVGQVEAGQKVAEDEGILWGKLVFGSLEASSRDLSRLVETCRDGHVSFEVKIS